MGNLTAFHLIIISSSPACQIKLCQHTHTHTHKMICAKRNVLMLQTNEDVKIFQQFQLFKNLTMKTMKTGNDIQIKNNCTKIKTKLKTKQN